MTFPRSRSEDSDSHGPSLPFLLFEGCWLALLLTLVASNPIPQWGKHIYHLAQQSGILMSQGLQLSFLSPAPQIARPLPSASAAAPMPQSPQGVPSPQPVAAAAAAPATAPAAIAPTLHPRWDFETIDYFLDVALNSEYGAGGAVRKWQDGLRIQVFGTPTDTDLQTLNAVIQELSQLTGLAIALVDTSPNVEIHFAPMAEFAQIEPNYKRGNEGFFWTWYEDGVIDRARILINSEQTDGVRSHLLREELTQSLGLMNDSRRNPDSIFYQGWTQTQTYSPADQAVIQMLYQPGVRPNMTQADVTQVLQRSQG